jgi:hypothetical protein
MFLGQMRSVLASNSLAIGTADRLAQVGEDVYRAFSSR